MQRLPDGLAALFSLTPARPLTGASPPPLHGVERGQAERSEAGVRLVASSVHMTNRLCISLPFPA